MRGSGKRNGARNPLSDALLPLENDWFCLLDIVCVQLFSPFQCVRAVTQKAVRPVELSVRLEETDKKEIVGNRGGKVRLLFNFKDLEILFEGVF